MDYFKKKKTKNWGWADLPCDIIELVLEKLHFTAQIRFAAVCRSWRGVSEKYCTSTSSSYRLPWLINHSWVGQKFSFNNRNKYLPFVCQLFDPYSQKSCPIWNSIEKICDNPGVSSFSTTSVYASKNGWLLLSREWLYKGHRRSSLFFHNPFTNNVILLPYLAFYDDVIKATFTSNPTSPECHVLVIVSISYAHYNIIVFVHYIYEICLSKDREWIQGTPETSRNELCSVHYMNGKLYCLFIGGLLKTYSLANKSWELLTPSLPAGNLDLYTTRCWLIEIGDANLIMIGCKSFELGNESEWSVFKFDWSIMSWILETSLKNIAFFISGDISYSTPSVDVNGKILQDFKVFYFDDDRCYIGEEYRKFYSSEHSGIKKTHRAMNFIEPPYVRK